MRLALRAALCLMLLTLSRTSHAQIEAPLAESWYSITAEAQESRRWRQGAYEVWWLRGDCRITQGNITATGGEAVLWIDHAAEHSGNPSRVLAYLEQDVWVDHQRDGGPHPASGRTAQSIHDSSWLGRFHSTAGVFVHAPLSGPEPQVKPAIFQRGLEARRRPVERDSGVRQTQFTQGAPTPQALQQAVEQVRRITVTSRSGGRIQARTYPAPERNERIIVVDSGVKVIVDAPEPLGVLDLEADRIVIWTENVGLSDLSSETVQPSEMPLEFYLEGNIVFRQGERVVYADRMYYNVPARSGAILDAELLTPVPEYEGLVRLKADVLQQLNERNFLAYGAAITSSRLGVPRYWLQSEELTFHDSPEPVIDPFTGAPAVDPVTGEPEVEHNMLATSRDNFVYVAGLPVFYWPTMATNLDRPTFYLDRLRLENDDIFGYQVLADFDMYQLLGVQDPPEGTRWTASTDYLSERGLGLGTNFSYKRDDFLGVPGSARGQLDVWGIDDDGVDVLGADRMAVPPEEDFRGRIFGRHRQHLPNNFRVTGELGFISDRNFLEQYYESEWDTRKDQDTALELKQYLGNSTWSLFGQAHVNDFFTEAERAQFDHFLLGQSVLDRFTWYGHSEVGYAHLEPAEAPENPVDAAKFDLLPYEVDREGARVITRQELDLPLQAGPVKVVPYVLGEMGYWGETIDREEVVRTLGQAGLRSSLPLTSIDPTVRNPLFNLNGLAHKVVFESEVFWAEADEPLERFPLYDPLDDNAQEHFRRRFQFDTFGGDIPDRFDSRYYALRNGMQSWVSAPSMEIADDLAIAKLGVRQRLQTKRGLPGQERIIDFIKFDVEGTFFPEAERDNFDEALGLVNYDFQWHLGDRFSVVSDGFADFFDDGLTMFTLGGILTRPERGSLYLGFRSLEGPISSNVIGTSLSYRTTEKWIVSAGLTSDLSDAGNIGENLSVTRIGESFLVRLGFSHDASRDNVGVSFAVTPRFLPSASLGEVGGVQIPPAGARGLE